MTTTTNTTTQAQQTGQAQGSALASGSAPPPLKPATTPQKIWLCVVLTLLSIAVLWCTQQAIQRTHEAALFEHEAVWNMPPGANLRAGPANFRYDPERKLLLYRGPLDAAEQMRLRDLLDVDAPEQAAAATPAQAVRASPASAAKATPAPRVASASAPVSAAVRANMTKSYHAAINLLAYKSQESQVKQMRLLIWLGMLGGALGALLRSFVDFVGNACYKNQLDLVQWWPLYATRPVVGAILGLLLVVMFKARLISGADTQSVSDSYWWLGMTALGGFSTIDVTARLRQAAKALFGGSK